MAEDKNSSPPKAGADDDAMPFEGILEQLETLVNQLEDGELSLEESLTTFEKGMTLAQKGGALLDNAEKRVEQLIESRDGELHAAPFTDEEPE